MLYMKDTPGWNDGLHWDEWMNTMMRSTSFTASHKMLSA